jgi:hypothetical protein
MLRRWYPPGADWDTPVAEIDVAWAAGCES